MLTRGEPVFVLAQNIAEFWNVCTRPVANNGLGLPPQDAEKLLRPLEAILTVFHDSPAAFARWRSLILDHEVKGVQVHDARVAAAMHVAGVTRLLTFNPKDFRRFSVTAVRPDEIP